MQEKLPDGLLELLSAQYGASDVERILAGYSERRAVTFRINTLKASADETVKSLTKKGCVLEGTKWYSDAYVLTDGSEDDLRKTEEYESGKIYLQSLSSMVPALLLDPRQGENILDMCAAPGGKTTQMSALSSAQANITACEKNAVRASRLEFNLKRQGASRVTVMRQDSRRLDDMFTFDKILLDAPCSGSGTVTEWKTGFTKELYNRIISTQTELLRKAIRLLKPGHRLVYSTCSVLKGENEDVLKKVLKSAHVVPIDVDKFAGMPLLPTSLPGTLCICPSRLYEGFFAAILEKN